MKFLNDVLGEVTISQDNDVITVIYINDNGYSRAKEMYQVPFDQKIYDKLLSYKSVRWLLAYCHKNLDLVFHVIYDLTEHTRTVSALAVDVPNQSLPSEDCTDTVNPFGSGMSSVANENDSLDEIRKDLPDVSPESSFPPVALAPTTGDTPFQEMPLDNSLVFKLWSPDYGVTLRYDYSSDYITITKIKNLRPVFEIGLWYSAKNLALLLTARTPPTLFALAQALEVDYGVHTPLEAVA